MSETIPQAERAVATTLRLGAAAIAFAGITRAPRYESKRSENNAEHSFMLGLVAPELAGQLHPELDIGLVAQFALVHDLIELETGDAITFALDATQLAHKAAKEHTHLESLLSKLPPHTASLVARYEAREEPEARFVRYVDKLLPLVVNILGAGEEVMRDVFAIADATTLRTTETACTEQLHALLPDQELTAIREARAMLAELFQQKFEHSL